MKVVAAYLLAVLGGNEKPSSSDINTILKSVGASGDEETINQLISELEGKSVFDVLAQGKSQLAASSAGSSAGSSAAGDAPAADSSAAPAKEEKKQESSSSESDAGGFGDLFG
ncbi:large subunit ribosomal protein LP2 [Acrasis kona]|uniref:Large subunit ribosomal protein LP2 n=1 Tax=Acrasis kona TaxID=1008807 RepID=A0AAW2Z597_9EUKA